MGRHTSWESTKGCRTTALTPGYKIGIGITHVFINADEIE